VPFQPVIFRSDMEGLLNRFRSKRLCVALLTNRILCNLPFVHVDSTKSRLRRHNANRYAGTRYSAGTAGICNNPAVLWILVDTEVKSGKTRNGARECLFFGSEAARVASN
jgi:hypothetical protein